MQNPTLFKINTILYLIQKSLSGFRDTSFAFYVNTLTTLLAIPVVYKLDVEVTKNKQSLLKTARRVVGMVDVNVFILVQIIVGMCWSWHKSFIAVFIVTELQASKTILGFIVLKTNYYIAVNL